jgi:hypothetical protein
MRVIFITPRLDWSRRYGGSGVENKYALNQGILYGTYGRYGPGAPAGIRIPVLALKGLRINSVVGSQIDAEINGLHIFGNQKNEPIPCESNPEYTFVSKSIMVIL